MISGRGNFDIIITGDNYGQDSNREYAAICPMFLGVIGVLVKPLVCIY